MNEKLQEWISLIETITEEENNKTYNLDYGDGEISKKESLFELLVDSVEYIKNLTSYSNTTTIKIDYN